MKWNELLEITRDLNNAPIIAEFFSSCPPLILNYLTLKPLQKGEEMITVENPCTHVYFLLTGCLQAIEEKVGEIPYSFTEIVPFDIVGDYELFSGAAQSAITLAAREKSLCLMLPSGYYLQWIKSDNNALFLRTKLLLEKLSIQTQWDRQFLFMDHKTRCLFIIYQECLKISPVHNHYILHLNRELLATKVSCSVRTVHRILKALEEEKILYLKHGKISLTKEQFENLSIFLH